ncbi:MAG: anti-sigma factor [Acidimicrobiia bacterium]
MTDPAMSNDIPEPPALNHGDLAALEALLSPAVTWAEPPEDVEQRVLEAIAAESDYAQRVADSTPGRGERRYLRFIGAAAALFLVAGVALAFLLAGDDPTRVELAGTAEAPNASAVARLETTPQGLRVILAVTGLPPAEAGTYYQGWVRNDIDGVSIGTFHLRGGDAEVELWAGVDGDDFPLITVTLQQVGEGPASSGVVVLRSEPTK